MLRASGLRPVETIPLARGTFSPAGRAGRCSSHRATALTGHVKPGTKMLGGKGALATRGQRSTLLPPANAAPAGDDRGGGQPEPPAQKPGPVWVFDRSMITLVVLYSLLGFYPVIFGQYFIAIVWVSFIVVTPFVLPVLFWWNESDD